ncbi:retropepsin-like aspartic protease [Pedobacter gandavensis]|uniref:retropepsin-like aspartic protease n=1 Tax=Pedobacter gandavensis TaxID=2679963 RepID=UPI00292FA1FE|nr:retropepsin-like aspartic protease [Pedobacter gandavensis]
MNKRYQSGLLGLALSLLSAFPTPAQERSAAVLISGLKTMFIQNNAEPVKSQLSTEFSIAAYTHESAIKVLNIIAGRYECDSVSLVAEQTVGTIKKLQLKLYDKGLLKTETGLYADQNYRICYVDLFDQLYGMNRYQSSKLKAKIPFEIHDGFIVLQVKINNHPLPLRLMFDTGADGIAVLKEKAEQIGLKETTSQNASVVGADVKMSFSQGNVVYLDSLAFRDQKIALFNELHKGMDGIIGNGFTRRYITKVDFDQKELSLYDYGDYQYEKVGASVPVSMPSGVYVIPGILSITAPKPVNGNFVFDSGAGYQLIAFRPFVKKNRLLVSGFKAEYNGSTSSMGVSSPTFSGKAAAFSFSHMPAVNDMPITLMAGGGANENWDPGFDGSIGLRLISRYNFTINMQKKEIHFSPNRTYDYPHDFAIGGFLFGFNSDGVLEVQSLTSGENMKVSLKPGAKVKSINGLAAAIFLKDKKQLTKLMSSPVGTDIVVESTQNGMSFKDVLVK